MESKHETYLEWRHRKDSEIKTLLLDDTYMLWIESFTKNHPKFTSQPQINSANELTPEDYSNVCKLDSLYSATMQYAESNYAKRPAKCIISFNNIGYMIEPYFDETINYSLTRLDYYSDAIEFNDICQNISTPFGNEMSKTLKDIENSITHLHSELSLSYEEIAEKIELIICDFISQ